MANVNLFRWRLDRRHVLRGLGTSLALPLLDAMRPRAGRADGALPRRCVFVYLPNGVNVLDWQVRTAGPDYEPTGPLLPLAPHRADLTLFSGLHHPHGLGKNHECGRIWLTGSELVPREGVFRNTISLDQRIAEELGTRTRFPSLELTATDGTLAWSREGVPLPAERKPGAVFERLFGAPPGGVEAARRDLATRASVLDLVLEDARALARRLGGEDRGKLDEYLAAVREVERRTARADAWLETPRPEVEPELAERLTRNVPDSAATLYYRTLFELVVLALRTDSTRVVTCMLGSEALSFALPELGIQQTRHELSHHNGDPDVLRRLTQADTFLVARFAELLDALAAPDERGERLLDRTVVLFGSGMAHGHAHGNANLPTILAGGRSLGLRHGCHLDRNLPVIGAYDLEDVAAHYELCVRPADPDARLSELLLTVLRVLGLTDERFADGARVVDEVLA